MYYVLLELNPRRIRSHLLRMISDSASASSAMRLLLQHVNTQPLSLRCLVNGWYAPTVNSLFSLTRFAPVTSIALSSSLEIPYETPSLVPSRYHVCSLNITTVRITFYLSLLKPSRNQYQLYLHLHQSNHKQLS